MVSEWLLIILTASVTTGQWMCGFSDITTDSGSINYPWTTTDKYCQWYIQPQSTAATHLIFEVVHLDLDPLFPHQLEIVSMEGNWSRDVVKEDEGLFFVVPSRNVVVSWNTTSNMTQYWILRYSIAVPEGMNTPKKMPFYLYLPCRTSYLLPQWVDFDFIVYNTSLVVATADCLYHYQIFKGVIQQQFEGNLTLPWTSYTYVKLFVTESGLLFATTTDDVVLVYLYQDQQWIFQNEISTQFPSTGFGSSLAYDERSNILAVGSTTGLISLYDKNFTLFQTLLDPAYESALSFVNGKLFVKGESKIYLFEKLDCNLWAPLDVDYQFGPSKLSNGGYPSTISANRNYDLVITDRSFRTSSVTYPNGMAYYYNWNGVHWTEIQRFVSETDASCAYETAFTDKYMLIACLNNMYLYERIPNRPDWKMKKILPYEILPMGFWFGSPPPSPERLQMKMMVMDNNYVIIRFYHRWDGLHFVSFYLDCPTSINCSEIINCSPPFECKMDCDAEGIVSYFCGCPDGYYQQNNTCIDANECSTGICGAFECYNFDGGYNCSEAVERGFSEMGTLETDIYPFPREDGFGSVVYIKDSILAISSTIFNPLRHIVYEYELTQSNNQTKWSIKNTLFPPSSSFSSLVEEIRFGISLSVYGNWTVVGSQRVLNGENVEHGIVYVYHQGELYQTLVPLPHDVSPSSQFGFSVSINGDVLVIGSPGSNDGSGLAYVYFKNENTFSISAVLSPPDEDTYGFGWSVCTHSGDIVIGAPFSNSGKGLAFYYNNVDFSLKTTLVPPVLNQNMSFGYAVDLSSEHVFISAPFGENGGSVFVYKITGFITYQQTLKSPTNSIGFGSALSIDGYNAIINSPKEKGAYYFSFLQNSWINKIFYSKPAKQFGQAVSISGRTVVFSALELYYHVSLANVGCWIGSTDFSPFECQGYCPNGLLLYPLACDNGPCTPAYCSGENEVCTFSTANITCACKEGYIWDTIDNKCVDINECLNSVCPESCFNTPGSYYCSCVSPSIYDPGSNTCYQIGMPKEIIDPKLLSSGDRFGEALTYQYPYLFIGAPGSNQSTGMVYIFYYKNSWDLMGSLNLNTTLSSGAEFGFSICTMGDWLVVGSPGESSVHFFNLINNSWVHAITVSKDDETYFGYYCCGVTQIIVLSIDTFHEYQLDNNNWIEVQALPSLMHSFRPGAREAVPISYISNLIQLGDNDYDYIFSVPYRHTSYTTLYPVNFGITSDRFGESISCKQRTCALTVPDWNVKGGVVIFVVDILSEFSGFENAVRYLSFINSVSETNFGKSVAISHFQNETFVVIGAGTDTLNETGVVYLFSMKKSREILKIVPHSTDIEDFGYLVTLGDEFIFISSKGSSGMVYLHTTQCQPGFGGPNCLDIDECINNLHNCEQICINRIGGFDCDCKLGYTVVNNTCHDINECLPPSPCDQFCTNTRGGFLCSCSPGYTMAQDTFICNDIDECLDPKTCPYPHQYCVNYPGNFSCGCINGFYMIDKHCEDINECLNISKNVCDAKCINTLGSYICQCFPGYTRINNTTCTANPCITSEWSEWRTCSDCFGTNFIKRGRTIMVEKSDGSPLCYADITPLEEVLQTLNSSNSHIDPLQVTYLLRDSFISNSWLHYQFLHMGEYPINITSILISDSFDLNILISPSLSLKRSTQSSTSMYNDSLCLGEQQMIENVSIPFLRSTIELMFPQIIMDRLEISFLENQCGINIHTVELPVPNTWVIIVEIMVPLIIAIGIAITVTIILTRKKADITLLPEIFQTLFGNYSHWEKKEKGLYYKRIRKESNYYEPLLSFIKSSFDTDDISVKNLYAVFNVNLLEAFNSQHQRMVSRVLQSPKLFNSKNWKNQKTPELKNWVYQEFEFLVHRFPWNDGSIMPIIASLHGTGLQEAWKICQTGFAAISTLDAGWYGKGIYFSSSIKYTLQYSKTKDQPSTIISLIIPGNPFPVTEHPREENSLSGAAFREAYQCHYILVDSKGFPAIDMEAMYFDEVVVNQEGQIFPVLILQWNRKQVLNHSLVESASARPIYV